MQSIKIANRVAAPPVYRPNVAQLKPGAQVKAGGHMASGSSQGIGRLVAPPAYPPQAVASVQRAVAPGQGAVVSRSGAPPVYRPAAPVQPFRPATALRTPISPTNARNAVQSQTTRPLGAIQRVSSGMQLRSARLPQPQHRPALGSPAPGRIVQRMIYLRIDTENFVSTHQDGKRPPGCLQGKQGDHTTPFTTLQNQIANAIENVTLDDAWSNLSDTFAVYKTLPGWNESTKYVTKTHGDYVDKLLTAKGDIDALQIAVNALLTLRNQIALTSLENGGNGNAEGKWAGSLQYQERQFQLGHDPGLQKGQVLDYMWKAFEHGRVDKLGQNKADNIRGQHTITMEDAYPMMNAKLKIDRQAIQDHYPKYDWPNYNPPF